MIAHPRPVGFGLAYRAWGNSAKWSRTHAKLALGLLFRRGVTVRNSRVPTPSRLWKRSGPAREAFSHANGRTDSLQKREAVLPGRLFSMQKAGPTAPKSENRSCLRGCFPCKWQDRQPSIARIGPAQEDVSHVKGRTGKILSSQSALPPWGDGRGIPLRQPIRKHSHILLGKRNERLATK